MGNTGKMVLKDCKKCVAEFFGTMILALVGLGAIILSPFVGGIFAAFAFGLALMAVVFIIGPISGAHTNPAVSLGFAIKGKLSWKDFVLYCIFQILGAIAGVAILFAIFKLINPNTAFRFGELYSNKATTMTRGLFATLITSIVMTFVFVLAWLGIVRKTENKAVAAVAIGLTLTAVLLAAGIVNPALNIAQAFFGGTTAMKELWLFIVAPLVGGLLAALTACYLFHGEDRKSVKENDQAPQIADVKQTAKKNI